MTDQTKRIVYINDGGGITILAPAPNCDLSVDALAKQDVPSGKKYKIVLKPPIALSVLFAWKHILIQTKLYN